jgi:sphinganine C4-monooxygenase
LHSVHQWLYDPYAFGTLYNHPVKGFLLNLLSALLSESIAGLSVRQAMLFLLSTCKTVDDYCGYGLPFDRLQMFSSNTADYHDIHHQVIDSISTTKSELTHCIMLVNLLHLLGAIKTKKASC